MEPTPDILDSHKVYYGIFISRNDPSYLHKDCSKPPEPSWRRWLAMRPAQLRAARSAARDSPPSVFPLKVDIAAVPRHCNKPTLEDDRAASVRCSLIQEQYL